MTAFKNPAFTGRSKAVRFAISGAVAVALFAGGSVSGKTPRGATAEKAQSALAKGKVEQAIELAEAAVEASPRDINSRLVLAQAYMKAGRFDSASTTFNDAMELGDSSARSALALALANVAAGRNGEAVAVLDDWRAGIPASDLGLAYALAGETSRGVAILTDGLRGGDNTPKMRQNLAYAYALDGRWGEARIMAAQDVPAGKLDARMSEWAANARPEDHQRRVAALLSVPVRSDTGQPSRLALATTPAAEQFASEAAAAGAPELATADPVAAPDAALASVVPASAAPAPVNPDSQPFSTAFAEPSFVSQPTVQPVPAKAARAAAAPAVARAAPVRTAAASARAVARRASGAPVEARPITAGGSHLVQLGSFSSEQGARRAWGIFAAKNPELKNFRMTITPATVRGRNFWRVAAAGLDSGGASGLCSSVRTRGGVCFAYAASNPPATNVPGRGQAGPQRARRR